MGRKSKKRGPSQPKKREPEKPKRNMLETILKILGVTSLIAIPTVLLTFNHYSPKVIITNTKDDGFELKNNGLFPLVDVKVTQHKVRGSSVYKKGPPLNYEVVREDHEIELIDEGELIAELSPTESLFIEPMPRHDSILGKLGACTYTLKVSFRQRFVFFNSPIKEKAWSVSGTTPGSPSGDDVGPMAWNIGTAKTLR